MYRSSHRVPTRCYCADRPYWRRKPRILSLAAESLHLLGVERHRKSQVTTARAAGFIGHAAVLRELYQLSVTTAQIIQPGRIGYLAHLSQIIPKPLHYRRVIAGLPPTDEFARTTA